MPPGVLRRGLPWRYAPSVPVPRFIIHISWLSSLPSSRGEWATLRVFGEGPKVNLSRRWLPRDATLLLHLLAVCNCASPRRVLSSPRVACATRMLCPVTSLFTPLNARLWHRTHDCCDAQRRRLQDGTAHGAEATSARHEGGRQSAAAKSTTARKQTPPRGTP